MKGKGLSSLIPKKSSSRPSEPAQKESVDQELDWSKREKQKAVPIGKSYSFSYHLYAEHREPPQFEKITAPTETVLARIADNTDSLSEEREKVSKSIHHASQEPSQKRGAFLSESIFHIEIDKIKPNPYQPRHEFEPEALNELAQSIREFGVLQPLIVSKITRETEAGTAVEYQLIVGERRLKAAKKAGLERIPAIIRAFSGERVKLEIALIENIQRSNLSPLESAKAYARLQDEFGLTQREIADRVGKSRETIANTLRLLQLSPEVQHALQEGKINESHARTLLGVQSPHDRTAIVHELTKNPKSVRALRAHVSVGEDSQKRYWEERLEEKLGTPVSVTKKGTRGKVVIQFYSDEEWKHLLSLLVGEAE